MPSTWSIVMASFPVALCHLPSEAAGDFTVVKVFTEEAIGAAFAGRFDAVAVVDEDFHRAANSYATL